MDGIFTISTSFFHLNRGEKSIDGNVLIIMITKSRLKTRGSQLSQDMKFKSKVLEAMMHSLHE